MAMTRFAYLLAALAAAHLPAQETTIRTTVTLVVAPTTATDRAGHYVHGLTETDFVLYDNRVPQKVQVDVSFVPISLVIAVQSSSISAAALAKIQKIGSMIEPLILGERGEAAVLAFDDDVRTLQPFTSDPQKLIDALRKIDSGAGGSCLIDAVMRSVRLLTGRPPDHRRVILLISETKDRSSKAKLQDAVTLAQQNNVLIYPLTYSAFLTAFTAKPGTAPQPAGGAGVNLLAIFTEIARLAEVNTAEALSQYTGGRRLSFLKQKGLEQAISLIAEELHSQYFLSFTPPAPQREEFHEIRVEIRGRPDLVTRTRPGYWLAGPPSP